MEFNIANVKFHLELNISNFEFQKQECFARYFEKRAAWLNSLKIKDRQINARSTKSIAEFIVSDFL